MTRDFAQLDGLVRLSSNKGIDIRPMLLRVLTDLYVQEPNHSREREQQYCELALRLLSAVDVPTRVAVAGKLAPYRHAPKLVLDRLVADVPEVAGLLSPRGSQMGEPTPGGPEPPPAQPRDAAPFFDAPRQPFMPGDEGRSAFPAAISPALGEAFLDADSGERNALLSRLEDEVQRGGEAPTLPFSRTGALERLERAALGGEGNEFARELQQGFEVPRRTAARIAEDPSGEALIVAAKALGMRRDALVRVLLFLNPAIGRSVERVFSLVRLYDETSTDAAFRIFASWRESALPRSGASHQSVHAGGPVPAATGLMANARRPLEAPADGLVDRRQPASPRDRRQGTT